MFRVKVFVSLKADVMDPQGQTIRNALHTLGFNAVREVKAGKYFELLIDEIERQKAETMVKKICTDLLSNPVIEDFKYTIENNS
ncbi:MAG: phosphoribosylformylglycinamidine synthase subunit PurS [Candidatus Sumerlaeia bacterium]|nr:phosphoribosylformylglycinamidine synthase subunit PurS [Candidatus Sumerlaeia bacterium]